MLVGAASAGLWWVSYGRNRALIDSTIADVAAYTAADHGLSKQTNRWATATSPRSLPPLGRLRNLPAGYTERGDAQSR